MLKKSKKEKLEEELYFLHRECWKIFELNHEGMKKYKEKIFKADREGFKVDNHFKWLWIYEHILWMRLEQNFSRYRDRETRLKINERDKSYFQNYVYDNNNL